MDNQYFMGLEDEFDARNYKPLDAVLHRGQDALKVLIDENMIENAAAMGKYSLSGLSGIKSPLLGRSAARAFGRT